MGRWLVVHALSTLALGGCGRLSFDEAEHDAAPDAPFGPFVAQPIAELTTSFHEDDPALPGDELEIYFDSDRPGGLGGDDIWRATRPTQTSPWDPPQPVAELNTTGNRPVGLVATGSQFAMEHTRANGRPLGHGRGHERADSDG